jgi:putative toxin-antitoxin system antitoxin component (TIGR02293 family)
MKKGLYTAKPEKNMLCEPTFRKHKRIIGGSSSFTPHQIIHALNLGLPIEELEALQEMLAVSMDRLATLLGIPKATLHRRKAEGRLTTEESDRIMRYARLMGRAVEVLDTAENARRWLSTAQFGLGGIIPLEFAQTEVGAREVDLLLGRIEHGICA